jgi:hypothetical protein
LLKEAKTHGINRFGTANSMYGWMEKFGAMEELLNLIAPVILLDKAFEMKLSNN